MIVADVRIGNHSHSNIPITEAWYGDMIQDAIKYATSRFYPTGRAVIHRVSFQRQDGGRGTMCVRHDEFVTHSMRWEVKFRKQ